MNKLNFRAFASMVMLSGAALAASAIAPQAYAATGPADSAYIEALNSRLAHAMVYPTSREMREFRPQGTTQVWLDVDRAGKVRNAGVGVSSGRRLLDHGAVHDVLKSRLPAMPEDAFVGEATHRFVVQVNYVADAPSR